MKDDRRKRLRELTKVVGTRWILPAEWHTKTDAQEELQFLLLYWIKIDAPEVLTNLRDEVLPAQRAYHSVESDALELDEYIEFHRKECRPQDRPPQLTDLPEDDVYRRGREALIDWATRWNLDAPWIFGTAQITVDVWCFQGVPEELDWDGFYEWPDPVPIELPTSWPRDDQGFARALESWGREVVSRERDALRERGYATSARKGTADSTCRAFVHVHVLGKPLKRVAKELSFASGDPTTLRKSLRSFGKAVGLPLRSRPTGRPRTVTTHP